MDSTIAKILVTDASRGSAIAIIRSLARSGYEVVAADSDSRSPGLASRYAKHRVVYACPKSDPHQFIEDVLAAVKKHEIDMIFPVTEQSILPLEAERDRIDNACRVPWAPVDSAATVRDKNLTFQLAEKLNVPYPRTCLVHTVEEAISAGADLGWPLVLKPNSSHTLTRQGHVQMWNVTYALDEQNLRQKMKPFEGKCPVLLQEYFQGAGVGVEVLAHEGTPICVFQHRRLREVPLTGGVSSLRRSDALDPQLYAYTLDLLKALNWTGLAMMEFKQNEQGEARLMEINGRTWGSLPVAIAAGVDFPVKLCELTLNGPSVGPLPSPEDFQVGVHVQNFQKELSWILRVLRGKSAHPVMKLPKRRDAVGAIVDLFRPSYAFDILSFRDPMPGVRVMSNLCRSAWRSLTSRMSPRTRLTATDYPGDSQAHGSVAIKQSKTSRAD